MHRHSIADVGEQLGRRSEEYRDVVTGGDRLTQHVAPSAPVAPKMMTRAISLLLH